MGRVGGLGIRISGFSAPGLWELSTSVEDLRAFAWISNSKREPPNRICTGPVEDELQF